MCDPVKVPKGEILWETYYKDGSPAFIVTSKPQRDAYFAYKVEETQLKKLGKAKNPVDLHTKFIKEGFK